MPTLCDSGPADLENYKEILQSGKQSVLVEFYAPWYVIHYSMYDVRGMDITCMLTM